LAPTGAHRLVHIRARPVETVEAIFCKDGTACVMIDAWRRDGVAAESYAHPLGYDWA